MSNEAFGSKDLISVCALIIAGSVVLTAGEPSFKALKRNGGDAPTGSAKRSSKPGSGPTLPTYPELSTIASNFDVKGELTSAWGTGALPISNPQGGSFGIICNSARMMRDDPLDVPGVAGAADLHEFVGNTNADASSSYASLRTAGASSCMSPVDRSSTWFPAMLDGRGSVVRPDYISIVYRRPSFDDPRCGKRGKFCLPLPNGLRFAFGAPASSNSTSTTGDAYFDCDGPGAVPGRYADLATAAKNCPLGARLGVIIKSPSCWDGSNLDSVDHRRHVAYAEAHLFSSEKCPSTHPYYIPGFTMSVWYSTDGNLDRSGAWDPHVPTWHFASDERTGQPLLEPGSTFHAGWYGAWDNGVHAMWIANCIDKKLVCSQGDLGNGQQIRTSWPLTWVASPHLVPDPYARPISRPTPVIADDGDSISVYWGGNWTGLYAASRNDEEFHGFAVGGSGIAQMNARWPQLVAVKPTIVMGMIGTNDSSNTSLFPTDQSYTDALAEYMDRARASGAKIVWGTLIARGDLTGDKAAFFDARRRVINEWLRSQVGKRIDALLPFDSDPRFGTIEGMRSSGVASDGVHPGDGYGAMATIAKPYIDAIIDGTPVPAVPAAAR